MTTLTFNRGLSAVIGKELHADLSDLRNSLPKTGSWDAATADRLDKLSRIARTAQLRAVHKVLATISQGARSMTTGGNDALQDATSKMLQALLSHLNELVVDHKNTPLRLARPLHTLQTQLGITTSPVLSAELFMPFTPEDVGDQRPSALPTNEFATAIRDYRAAYQAGLVQLLKDNDRAQYAVLRQSLISIEPKNPHPGYRVFFEASIAIQDVLTRDSDLDNLAKWVLSKIDTELNAIADGSTNVDDNLLSAMLQLVARADPETSARVRKLQDQYNLKAYLTDVNGIDPAIVDKFTQVLVRSREVWSQFAVNEPERVAKLIAELQSKSAMLKNAGFTVVINALNDVISSIASGQYPVNGDQLSLEGAGALLILEQQLRDGSNMNTAQLSASRLYSLIGKTSTYVATTNDSQTAATILHTLAAQVQEDLTQLEPRLLELLNDQRDGEQDMRAGLLKISRILGIFGRGNSLVRAFALFENTLTVPETSDEKADVATRFAQLSTIVESLKTSEKNAMSAAQKWLDSQVRHAAPTERDKFKDVPNDPEMLEIFLEEAQGILLDLDKWQHQLANDPSMFDTVVNMRRGYHTLKGSGRMVGLVRFGELAYIGELLLNNWIADKKLPTDALLAYYTKSYSTIVEHIENFKTKGFSYVEYDDFEQEAIALGGSSLADAPQSKKGGSVKFGGAKAAPAKTVERKESVFAPVQAPAPLVQEKPFALAPAPVSPPLFPLEEPKPLVLAQEPVMEIPPLVIEEPEAPANPIDLKFSLPEKPSVADLSFDEPSTSNEQEVPAIPNLPSTPLAEPRELPSLRLGPDSNPPPDIALPVPAAHKPPAPTAVKPVPRKTPAAWNQGKGAPAKPQTKPAATPVAAPAAKSAVKKPAPKTKPVKAPELTFWQKILALFKRK